MRPNLGGFAAACASSVALAAPVAEAQKPGSVLIMSHFDSPASMSMHEEATGAVNRWCPVMDIPTAIVEQVIRRASLPQQPRQRPSRQRVCTHWSALFVESRPGKAGKLVAKRDRHWATPIAAGESELSSSSICCAGASIFPLRGISASPKKLVSIT